MSKLGNDQLIETGIDVVNHRIQVFGAVDMQMAKRIFNGLSLLNRVTKKTNIPITIALSTYGGDADVALGIHDMIKHNPRPVHVCAVGPCMSAGTIILQSAAKRMALPSTIFLLHFGNESAVSQAERKMNHVRAVYWNKLISERAKINPKLVIKWHQGETYLTASDALLYKLIDEIVEKV